MTTNATDLGKAILATGFSTTIAKTETFALNMADFPVEAIVEFIRYGAQRKFNDAIGGADKTAKEKVDAAKLMIQEFKDGKLGKRREGGGGATVETLAARKVMRAIVKGKMSAADYAAFGKLDPADQLAKLDAWVAKNADAIKDQVAAEVVRMNEAREAKAALGTVKIDL